MTAKQKQKQERAKREELSKDMTNARSLGWIVTCTPNREEECNALEKLREIKAKWGSHYRV